MILIILDLAKNKLPKLLSILKRLFIMAYNSFLYEMFLLKYTFSCVLSVNYEMPKIFRTVGTRKMKKIFFCFLKNKVRADPDSRSSASLRGRYFFQVLWQFAPRSAKRQFQVFRSAFSETPSFARFDGKFSYKSF